ncbi:hypothetical protein PBY51_002246 [Eleginops maclovinus]|uniref:PWWP domain-containing protein n=1 Tax=Eleginops maclovinus TaxID=56733 RepID=A0AAN8AJ62_ELEMC|nr:hypothetical protein PBY51_002246 [Eleginops maclovinus]
MAAVAAEPGAARREEEEEPGTELPREPGPELTGLTGEPGLTPLQSARPRPELWMEDGGGQRVGPELQAGSVDEPGERTCSDRTGGGRFSPLVPGDPEGGRDVSAVSRSTEPRAVFLLSFPAPPPVTEAGLSLTEPAEPTTNETTDRAEPAGWDRDHERDYTLTPAEVRLSDPEERDSPPTGRMSLDSVKQEPPSVDLSPDDLSPGSEVRVSLDHVINDALVVSFQRGQQLFSGVLMDVSRRFGPYGIPITVLPRRDDRSGPLMMSLPDVEVSTKQEEISPPAPPSSKLPPLFQEGAPYPPPLFLRDTYNQALPQPLPRKIRRPKRRYRCEEPTSIMNAIKLRPRQVLCDKCKGVVGGGRESQEGPQLKDEASRRRRAAEGQVSSEVKRLRGDDRRPPNDRRPPSGIHVSSSASSSSSRVLRGGVSSSGRLCLNSKKAPPPRGPAADVSKAQQALKKLSGAVGGPVGPAQRRPRDQDLDQDQTRSKAVTRASSLQNQRVHFTRRLQSAAPPTLPPRMRLKPQRYRTDDQVSPPSPPKLSSRSPPTKPIISPTPPPPSSTAPTLEPPLCAALETQEALCPPMEEGPCSSPPSECSSTDTFDLLPPGHPPTLLEPLCPASSSPRANETPVDGGDGGDLKRSKSSSFSPPPPTLEGEEEGGDLKRRSKSSMSPPPPPPVEGEEAEGEMKRRHNSSCSPTAPPPVEGEEEEGEMKRRHKSSCSPPAPAPPSVEGEEEEGEMKRRHKSSCSPLAPPPVEGEEEEGEMKRRRKSSTSSSSSSSSSSPPVFSKPVSKVLLPDGRSLGLGDIVWAKISGFPWWPARVLSITVSRRSDTGLAVRQEARVSWFGSPTTSFLPLTQLSPFLESFQCRFDRKRKGPYRRAIAEAASAAKQLTPEVRALLTQFET